MITPLELEDKQFSTSFRGYKKSEVQSFLKELNETYAKLYKEHREMTDELDLLRRELAALKATDR